MFVQRDDSGKIIGAFGVPQPGYAEEELAEDHPDLVAFNNPPPNVLSRAETINGLVAAGIITPQEGEKSNVEIPQAIAAVFANLPSTEETAARILFLNFVEAHRNDPLITALGAANDMSDDDIDDFFRMAKR